MAKAKKPAAKKSSGASARKPAAKRAASTSSASAAASKASTAAKVAAAETRTSVSPSEMKKELEAKAKPVPEVAKETPKPAEVSEPPKVQETSTPMVAPAEPQSGGSVFWPLVIGGVIAAVLGFLASELDLLGTRGQTDDLRASVNEQNTRLSALEAVEPPVIPEVTFPELDDLSAQVTSLSDQLNDIDTRLSTLEKRPISEGSEASQAAVAAYERELAALQASVEDQRAEIEGLLENALSVEQATAEAARLATQQAALSELSNAINNGQPFADALNALSDTGVSDVPAALSDVAADGVQTLNALQSDFPDNARASLAAARASGSNENETGLGGFLKRQLGARSVTPREGNDPDAVLSRAEAAVREGRLNDALSELDALPEPSQEAMQTWLESARTRHAAEAAIKELSQSLTAN